MQTILPTNNKVSVAWQIIFTFLPIVNFWAFYRIRTLRKYLLYVIVPSIVVSIVSTTYVVANPFGSFAPWGDEGLAFGREPTSFWVYIATNVVGFGLQGLAVYLAIVWSRLHNRRVDASTGQAPP